MPAPVKLLATNDFVRDARRHIEEALNTGQEFTVKDGRGRAILITPVYEGRALQRATGAENNRPLTEQEIAICQSFGLTEEEYRSARRREVSRSLRGREGARWRREGDDRVSWGRTPSRTESVPR